MLCYAFCSCLTTRILISLHLIQMERKLQLKTLIVSESDVIDPSLQELPLIDPHKLLGNTFTKDFSRKQFFVLRCIVVHLENE